MRVVLDIKDGMRIDDEAFYQANSMWKKLYKKKSRNGKVDVPSHKELAQILEADYTPIKKFFNYLNSPEDTIGSFGIGTIFTQIFLKAVQYSTNAEHCRVNISDDIWCEWHDFLQNNLGDFHTQNPTPLVDTVQYLNSISFDVKWVGQDRLAYNILFKYYPTQQARKDLIDEWLRDPEGIIASFDKDTNALGTWGF